MNSEKTQEYLKALYNIKIKMINQSYLQQEIIWKDAYCDILKKGVNVENLANLLALIHPDFYKKNGKDFSQTLEWYKKNSKFSKDITIVDKCEAVKYMQIECVFNGNKIIRGICHADHYWPHSLGGPSILENRLILCKYHNCIKTNNIDYYQWDKVPIWLKEYLKNIYFRKI